MLWRYATVKAGVRLDSERRYTMGQPGRTPAASEAVRRFLGFYGPATPGDFAEWAGLAKPHAQRLWDEVAGDLAEVRVGKGNGLAHERGRRRARVATRRARASACCRRATPTCRSPTGRCSPRTPSCASGCSGPWRAPERC